MKEQILIVEDQFVEADYLRLLLEQAGYGITGIARSVPQAQEMIQQKRPDFVLLDIFLKGKQTGIDLAILLAADNIPFVYLSANSNEDVLNAAKQTQPYGFLVKPFREKDLLVALEIARYRHAHHVAARYHKETLIRRQLKAIISDSGDWEQKLLKVVRALQAFIPFDLFTTSLEQAFLKCYYRIGFDEYQVIGVHELATITGKPAAVHPLPAKAMYYDEAAIQTFAGFQLKSGLEIPLRIRDGQAFSIGLYSKRPAAYAAEQLELFESIQVTLIQTIEALLQDTAQPATSSAKPPKELNGIIGKSHLLLNVFDQLAQVAPTETAVLILGETGTGKEKIASSIHDLSNRRNRPFIKINCAALSPDLIESALFGHEKGAFTGAHEKRPGIFERADKGTLFLDEVGDMPVELQVKLLRVLQEMEIERVGGRETIKVDVRIIAATNKNLEKEVADGRFRLDLYYRLNVFPVTLPALRERKEDIPALAYHFMNHFADKAGRKLSGISESVLKKMMVYKWPGNIRELEHLMERSVLLTKGSVIEEMPLPTVEKKDWVADVEEAAMKTIAENERDYIIAVLKKCNGRIWGPGAAAEILNLNPSTLKSKMKKLGIKKEYIH
ncbi:sigma 54-interacting transcriptional regulator [Chitinophaga sancti]|uniref:sigma 54-interacting transcriptional regulator n=1 Tax=Chitinophaga sancti TaxID=1004 RepID=UPI003F79060C